MPESSIIPRPTISRWPLLVLGSLVFAVGFFLWWQVYRGFLVDDAYITFRYSRNFFRGFGPVYNPGDLPVEGYTSPLWMAIMASGFVFGANPELLSLVLSGACGVILLLVFSVWAGRVLRSPWVRAFVILWLGTNYTFVSWGGSGLETMGHALSTVATMVSFYLWLADEKRRPTVLAPLFAGLLAALNCFLRPEGLMLFALELAVAVWALRIWKLGGLRLRSLAIFALAAAVPVAIHVAWRVSFYGSLLPNTFYVKATDPSPIAGLYWLAAFLSGHFVHWAVFGGLVLVFWFARSRLTLGRRRLWACLGIAIAAHSAYAVQLGGDVFEFRFLVQMLPALALWLGLGVEAVMSGVKAPRRATAIVCGALLLAGLRPIPALGYHLSPHAPTIATVQSCRVGAAMQEWRLIGEWLAKYARQPESIALTPAGLIPYLCDLRTLDLHGLNDARISHQRGTTRNHPGHKKVATPDYVQEWKPTYMLGSAWVDTYPIYAPGSVCVELKPNVYLIFRPLDRPAEEMRKLLEDRGAMVYRVQ